MIETLEDFIREFRRINEEGWIQINGENQGPREVGRVLETRLGIPENNRGHADFGNPETGYYELKASRGNSDLTLFTKSPMPRGILSRLRRDYGYPDETFTDALKLEIDLKVGNPTAIQQTGHILSIVCNENGRLSIFDEDNRECAHWDRDMLRRSFQNKFPHEKLVYVKSRTRHRNGREEFYYTEAFLKELNFERFINLLEQGTIVVSLRLGLHPRGSENEGKRHDHGVAFRISPHDSPSLFVNCRRIFPTENQEDRTPETE